MMRVCVPVVINMHSHTCAFIVVVLKIDRCTREERKVLSWREVPS
jgi:hypothetical protein